MRDVSPRSWTTSRTTSRKNLNHAKHLNWNLLDSSDMYFHISFITEPSKPILILSNTWLPGAPTPSLMRSRTPCWTPPRRSPHTSASSTSSSRWIDLWWCLEYRLRTPQWGAIHIFSQGVKMLMMCAHVGDMRGTHLFINSKWWHRYCNDFYQGCMDFLEPAGEK